MHPSSETAEVFKAQCRLLKTVRKVTFENIVGKEENAGYQHFLLFPQCFLSYQRRIALFESLWNCRLRLLSIWTWLNFFILVKG